MNLCDGFVPIIATSIPRQYSGPEAHRETFRRSSRLEFSNFHLRLDRQTTHVKKQRKQRTFRMPDSVGLATKYQGQDELKTDCKFF